MKKFMVLFLSAWMIFSLAACGNQNKENNASASAADNESTEAVKTGQESAGAKSSGQEDTETENMQETAGQTDELQTEVSASESIGEQEEAEGKTLVVYYSATGNTEEVANYIAAATGADTFELEPAEPYSDEDLDWTDDNSRVAAEHDNPDARAVELVADTVPDWEAYDTVFVGYPIWWGIAAWPVDGFIEANDFTGKTVVPFCTSSSSDLGESGELLAEAAGTGNWLEGKRFSSGTSEETVVEWLEENGLF